MAVTALELVHEMHLMIRELIGTKQFFVASEYIPSDIIMPPLTGEICLGNVQAQNIGNQFHVAPQPSCTCADITELNIKQWITKFNYKAVAEQFYRHFDSLNGNKSYVSIKLAEPEGFMAQEFMSGFWLRHIRQFQIETDEFLSRFDVKILAIPFEKHHLDFKKQNRYQILKQK
jgi:hypothetical protein